MGTPTYTPLANTTATGYVSTVTFSSIAAGLYRDLVLVVNATELSGTFTVNFNGNSSTIWSMVRASGNGTSATSSSYSASDLLEPNSGLTEAGTNANFIVNIMDYAVTDKHKTVLTRSNIAGNYTNMSAGRFASTSAVSSIAVRCVGGSFYPGSTFALYGIAA